MSASDSVTTLLRPTYSLRPTNPCGFTFFGFTVFVLSCLLCLGGLLLASPARAQSVPQAVGVASGTGGLNWVLWNNPDGTATLWKINGDTPGTVAANYTYGPYSGWTARSIATGSDGVPRILWTNTSGQISLWNLADANPSATCHLYGPYSGYTATALAISPSNTAPRILWNKDDGSIVLWNVDAAGDPPGGGTSTLFVFSAFTGYTAAALAVGGDNLPRILWNKPGGSISLWKVDTSGGFTHQEYGPYSGYTATALAAGPDSLVRIPWVYSDGTLSLWKVDAGGGFTHQEYGPYTNWAVKAIAVSSDNVAHPAWDNTNGSFSLWNIASNGSSTQNTYPEPANVSLSATSVNSGSSSTGTVTLNCPSPYGGTVVSLSSSNTAAATVPSSVTVPAGQTSATFTVTGQSVSSATPVTITANYWISQTATLSVNPSGTAAPADGAEFVSQSVPTTMVAGQTYTATVTMRNTGTATWPVSGPDANGYLLADVTGPSSFDGTWGTGYTFSNQPTAPGATQTFTMTLVAPTLKDPATPESHWFQAQMNHWLNPWFGALTPPVSITVNPAPDFSVSANPSSVSIAQGSSQTETVSLNNAGGFSGSVTLTASNLPVGVTAAFNPTSISGAAVSTMTLTASPTATVGTASVTITGTGAAATHTATVSLTVTANPILTSIGVSPASISLNLNGTQQFTAVALNQNGSALSPQPVFTWTVLSGGIGTVGSTGLYTAGVVSGSATVQAASGSVSGTAAVTVASASAGEVHFYPRSGLASRMVSGKFQGSNDGITYTDLYTVASQPADGAWTVAALSVDLKTYRYLRYLSPNGYYGNIAELEFYSGTGASAVKLVGTPFGTPGSWQNQGNDFTKVFDGDITTAFDAPDPGNGDFVGLDQGASSPPAPDSVGFLVSASASQLGAAPTGSASTALTVTSSGGFSGPVAFSLSGLPSGASSSFTPASSVSVSAGAVVADTLTIKTYSVAPGAYPLMLVATSGALSHSVPLRLTVAPGPSTNAVRLTDAYLSGDGILTHRIEWDGPAISVNYAGPGTVYNVIITGYSVSRTGGAGTSAGTSTPGDTPFWIDGPPFGNPQTQSGQQLQFGTPYTYTVTANYAYTVTGDPNQSGGSGIVTVGYCRVTSVRAAVADDQAVDSRLDPRYSTNTYLDHNFGATSYRGGLFAGYNNDPARIGRSLLKFALPALPAGQNLWRAGNICAYATRGFAAGTATVYCQRIGDGWAGQTAVWSLAPGLPALPSPLTGIPTASITYDGSTPINAWQHWGLFPDIFSAMSSGGSLSVALASTDEARPVWIYFAKKEYDATLAPCAVYSYGAPN